MSPIPFTRTAIPLMLLAVLAAALLAALLAVFGPSHGIPANALLISSGLAVGVVMAGLGVAVRLPPPPPAPCAA